MKLSKYYSYIIIGVLFPVFLCLIVVGERRNKRPVENINVSQANPGRTASLASIKGKDEFFHQLAEHLAALEEDMEEEDIGKYNPFDVVIDGQEKVRLQRAMVFARFLFSEYGNGDRIITRTAKTPGYKHEKIGFRGLEWGTDVSQIDDLGQLFPSDSPGVDAVGYREGIQQFVIGEFCMMGISSYLFYKNKLVGAHVYMTTFSVYDKLPYCIHDIFGPPSYTSSDGKQVWDGNVTDISLAFERSKFMGKIMHTYTIEFIKKR